MSTLTTPFQHHVGSPSQYNKARKKWVGVGRELAVDWKEVKLSFLSDDMIVRIENSNEFTPRQNIPELISEFTQVAGSRSTHKNSSYFYISSSEQLEIKNKIFLILLYNSSPK